MQIPQIPQQNIDFLKTYKPLLIIVAMAFVTGTFLPTYWMVGFMGLFLFILSLLKLLDLNGFAEGYAMYDIIAQRWKPWGYIYPFVEFLLAILFLSGQMLALTCTLTMIIMGVSAIGVYQAIMQKKHIHCACLGTVIQIPLTTVTLIEDAAMFIMALITLMLTLF